MKNMKILKILFLCAFCIIFLIIVIDFANIDSIYIIERDEEGTTTSMYGKYPRLAELGDILYIALVIDLCLIWVIVYTQFLTEPQKIPSNSL